MRLILFLLVLAGLPPTGLAQEAQEKKPGETKDDAGQRSIERPFVVTVEESLPPVASETTIATKMAVPIHDIPASVTVIPQSLFKSQDAVILSDALSNAAGVNIQTNFGVHDYFLIRGFDSLSSGLVLTDAASEPEATFYHLYNVDQIEVLRGPSTFLYGGSPLSGAVNLARKQPRLGERFFQGAATFGSFGTARGQFDVNWGGRDSPVAFRLNAMGQRADGYRDNRENYQAAVNPAIQWKAGERNTFTFNFEYVSNEYTPDAGIPLVGDSVAPVSRRTSYGSPYDDSDQDIFRFRFDWESYLSDRIRWRTKIYYTDLEWLSDGTLLNGVVPDFQTGSLQVVRLLNQLDDRQKLLGAQFETIFSFDTGSVRHELLVGFEANRLTDQFSLQLFFLPPADLSGPRQEGDLARFPLPDQGQLGDARSRILAPYVVDRILLTERLHLFLGGRIDFLDYREEFSETRREEAQFNPLVGILLQPRRDLSFYVNGGSAFAPPSSLVVGERKPEESRQVEGGVKKKFLGERLQAQFAVYHLEKTNIAIPDQNGFLRETGSQRSRGFEFSLNSQHGPLWHTFASYSYNRSELTEFSETAIVNLNPFTFGTVDRAGNRAPFAPRHIFSVWTSRQFSRGFGIGVGSRYVSGQFIAPDNGFELDDYLVFDAVASYGLHNWKISLNFKNLSNRDYAMRGFGTNSVIPADGFGVFATLTFTR